MVIMICVTALEHGIKGFKCIIGCAHTRFAGECFPVGEICSCIPLLLKVVCKLVVIDAPFSKYSAI
jgi:hypothetical protein